MTSTDDPLVAARAARAASAAWADAGIGSRLRVLQAAGAMLVAEREALLEALCADGLSSEMAEYWAAWMLQSCRSDLLRRYARGLIRGVMTEKGGELLVRRPDGVVLLTPPANSPTINSISLFSILLPGNAVVVRVPERAEGLRFLVERIFHPALACEGFRREIVSPAVGPSREVIGRLLPSSEVDTLVFFGSSRVGRSLAEKAFALGKKVVLELDGSDHLLVWKDADVAGAVESASRAWHASTQPCVVPKHVLLHPGVADRFVAAFLDELPRHARTVEADPRAGRLLPVGRIDEYEAALQEIAEEGEILSGGYRMTADGTPDEQGAYVSPTVVALPASVCLERRLRCFEQEIFFPLVPVVRFDGGDEEVAGAMLQLVRRSPFGLRLSAWTRDAQIIGRLVREVADVGLLLFNEDHTQAPAFASPWGGPKRSGGPFGESNLFWERTSRLQAISCHTLSRPEVQAVLDALWSPRRRPPEP